MAIDTPGQPAQEKCTCEILNNQQIIYCITVGNKLSLTNTQLCSLALNFNATSRLLDQQGESEDSD